MDEDQSILQTASYEQELWKKFQQGDEKALSDIYSRYFDILYNYGFKFVADPTLIEDCIQELFLKLIRSKQNLSLPDSVKAYLLTALRSQLLDKVDKLKKYPSGEINESIEFEVELHQEVSIIQHEENTARQKKIQQALAELTPRQREAIFLKYEAGISYPQIAEILGLTQKAAYKLIGRAIQTLRNSAISILITFICSDTIDRF